MRLYFLLVLAGFAMLGAVLTPSAEPPLFAITGRVFDGTGAPPIPEGVVLIRGDRIMCVGTRYECPLPGSAVRLDAGTGTILPGLIDLHVHARPHYAADFVPAGVTSVRDANNTLSTIRAVRAVPGAARVFAAGPLLDGDATILRKFEPFTEFRPGGQDLDNAMPILVSNADEARNAVDELAKAGVSVIKLYERLTPDAFGAAVKRAREIGLPVMVDLGTILTRGLSGAEVDAMQAMEAGVTTIEHMSGFALAYERLGGDPRASDLDDRIVSRLAQAIVESGTAMVPTLTVDRHFAESLPDALKDLPGSTTATEKLGDHWHALDSDLSPRVREDAAFSRRLSIAILRRARELGNVRIGAGTDVPAAAYLPPGGAIHLELEALVRDIGLSPLEALVSATGEAAQIIGSQEIGVLRPGSYADILIVHGDPLADIGNTKSIAVVIKGGILATPGSSL